MPGFNQRGPMNEGPATGRRRGFCTGAVETGQGFSRRENAGGYGIGMARRQGRRGCLATGWGGGVDPRPAPINASVVENTLQDRADRLEAELAEVKIQLKRLSESKE